MSKDKMKQKVTEKVKVIKDWTWNNRGILCYFAGVFVTIGLEETVGAIIRERNKEVGGFLSSDLNEDGTAILNFKGRNKNGKDVCEHRYRLSKEAVANLIESLARKKDEE